LVGLFRVNALQRFSLMTSFSCLGQISSLLRLVGPLGLIAPRSFEPLAPVQNLAQRQLISPLSDSLQRLLIGLLCLGGALSASEPLVDLAPDIVSPEATLTAPTNALTRDGLVAKELARWSVQGANQGVAVDNEFFYGVGNFEIGKHRKDTGSRVAEWTGLQGGPTIHLNGGHVSEGQLILAHSNYPQLPMASSLEVFNAQTLDPVSTHSFGIRLGSLTWAERYDGYWWACFANYNHRGTTPGFDNRWTHLGKFDDNWQLIESWLFPSQIVEAWGQSSSSGGSWGDDGLLYLTGHDKPELYVVRLPQMGVTLDFVTTISVPFEGQSWAWDRGAAPQRVIYGISRKAKQVVVAEIPAVPSAVLAPSN